MSLPLAIALAGCGSGHATTPAGTPSVRRLRLSSPAFVPGATLPRRFTCDGAGASPPLAIAAVPASARQLAVVVDDPDAPGGDFTHWVLFGLPPHTATIPEGAVPAGARQARNDFGAARYGAPCPPSGSSAHRYVFTVYALRSTLTLPNGTAAATARAAIGSAQIGSGTLLTRYSR